MGDLAWCRNIAKLLGPLNGYTLLLDDESSSPFKLA